MNLGMSAYPAIGVATVFILIFSLPIWLAARVVRADNPTLIRSAVSLVLGTVCAVLGASVGGGLGLLLAPLAYLLSFKFVLGTSIVGAIVLSVLALAGYVGLSQIGGGGAGA